MKKIKCFPSILFVVSTVLFSCSGRKIHEAEQLAGVYKNEDFTYSFKNGKCYGTFKGKPSSESYVKVKGDLVYISPNIPDMKRMIRNVWVVWELNGERLVSKHIEDMNDGTRFYEEQAGEIILLKQK